MRFTKSFTWRIAATFGYVAMIVVNALANALPINGLTTGDVANLYPSLFTPAGLTFSIWSLIYLFLLGFIVFTWVHRKDNRIDKILPFFVVSCALNCSWILVWHYLFTLLSVFVMLALLAVLTYLFVVVHSTAWDTRRSSLLVKLPFSLYFSWICIATIANISAYLVSEHWNGFGVSGEVWTIIMLATACILTLLLLWRYHTPIAALTLLWTLLGIYLRWKESEYIPLFYSLIIFAAVLILATLFSFRRKPEL